MDHCQANPGWLANHVAAVGGSPASHLAESWSPVLSVAFGTKAGHDLTPTVPP
jgi:hypothetical protein